MSFAIENKTKLSFADNHVRLSLEINKKNSISLLSITTLSNHINDLISFIIMNKCCLPNLYEQKMRQNKFIALDGRNFSLSFMLLQVNRN